MSSRKMSLSGWRPAVVTSLSRAKLEPAFGPGTHDQHPAGRHVVEVDLDLGAHRGGVELEVDGRPVLGRLVEGEPHDEQKFDSDGSGARTGCRTGRPSGAAA